MDNYTSKDEEEIPEYKLREKVNEMIKRGDVNNPYFCGSITEQAKYQIRKEIRKKNGNLYEWEKKAPPKSHPPYCCDDPDCCQLRNETS